MCTLCCFFEVYGDHRDLHVLTHSFPTRRSSDRKRPLKVVCACGNGTAGAFAPEALRRMGVAVVVEMDCGLDWTFPRYNPNPEDSVMLHAMGDRKSTRLNSSH